MICCTVAFYGQVGIMQEELHALGPQLVDTSEKTEKLMIKIEQDTVAVEAKKEVCICYLLEGRYFHVVCKLTVLWYHNKNGKFYSII
jgi:hypothetical protein